MRLALLATLLTACADAPRPEVPPPGEPAVEVAPDAVPPPTDPLLTQVPTEATPLTADGWGPLVIGMTRGEIVAALGEDAQPDAVGGPDPESCDQFRPMRAPERFVVMVEDGALTRISISEGSRLTTEDGFGVGADADAIKGALGADAGVTPHEYQDVPASYLTVWRTGDGGPGSRGIRYEVGMDGRVQAIHAGGPSIQYVEGCL